eukprot:366068-Chlamydomonas_euryale.AAC.8
MSRAASERTRARVSVALGKQARECALARLTHNLCVCVCDDALLPDGSVYQSSQGGWKIRAHVKLARGAA